MYVCMYCSILPAYLCQTTVGMDVELIYYTLRYHSDVQHCWSKIKPRRWSLLKSFAIHNIQNYTRYTCTIYAGTYFILILKYATHRTGNDRSSAVEFIRVDRIVGRDIAQRRSVTICIQFYSSCRFYEFKMKNKSPQSKNVYERSTTTNSLSICVFTIL